MTQQETIEYNKRCAEFLGGVYEIMDAPLAPQWFNLPFSKRGIPEGLLKFHSDWIWIHEVIEAINKTQNPKQGGDTTHSTLKREVQALLGKSAKEALIQAIDKFLIWYNGKRT